MLESRIGHHVTNIFKPVQAEASGFSHPAVVFCIMYSSLHSLQLSTTSEGSPTPPAPTYAPVKRTI